MSYKVRLCCISSVEPGGVWGRGDISMAKGTKNNYLKGSMNKNNSNDKYNPWKKIQED